MDKPKQIPIPSFNDNSSSNISAPKKKIDKDREIVKKFIIELTEYGCIFTAVKPDSKTEE